MQQPRCHIDLFWSDEDASWIADVPDLKHCSAHGDTPEEALREVQVAMAAWLEAQAAEGRPIPEPRYRPAIYAGRDAAWARPRLRAGTKHRLGKLPDAGALLADLPLYLDQQGFAALGLTLAAARLAGSLPGPHRDPFDRLLVAQSLLEGIRVGSHEMPFDGYGVERLW